MKAAYQPQSARVTARRLAEGTSGHVAIGDFLDDFYAASSDAERLALLTDEPEVLPDDRWAAYLAATVETLCGRYGLDVPEWTQDRRYFLAEPWFTIPGGRMYLLLTTPCPFVRHGVFVGDRVLMRV